MNYSLKNNILHEGYGSDDLLARERGGGGREGMLNYLHISLSEGPLKGLSPLLQFVQLLSGHMSDKESSRLPNNYSTPTTHLQ